MGRDEHKVYSERQTDKQKIHEKCSFAFTISGICKLNSVTSNSQK